MAVVNCEVLSHVWIRQAHATNGVVYTWDSFTARLSPLEQRDFLCSGDHTYTFTAGTNALEYGVWSQVAIPFEPFLMGLAGLVCGLMVARVFSRRI